MAARWYVVNVYSGSEKKSCRIIKRTSRFEKNGRQNLRRFGSDRRSC